MKQDLEGTLLKILDFLNIEPVPQRLECVIAHANGMFKRKSSSNHSKLAFFNNKQQKRIDNIIFHLNRICLKHDLEGL